MNTTSNANDDCSRDSDNSLLQFLHSEALDLNLFRGQSKDFNYGQVYGGQVLGQAIKAAYETVEAGRFIHSTHAYFLRRGDVNAPIIYEVDRSLDGGSFSSRRVVAIQHGRQIFNLSASFQKEENGLEFARDFEPPLDVLENAIANNAFMQVSDGFHSHQAEFLDIHFLNKDENSNTNHVQSWFKSKYSLPDLLACHHSVLAYTSDMGILQASLAPHKLNEMPLEERRKRLIMASLDHAIWFHRPFRADEWLFHDCTVESTTNGRGLAFGRIYTKDGTLVASTSQEGLIRLKKIGLFIADNVSIFLIR